MTQLGELSLWLALLMSAWCTTLSIQGALLRREALAVSGARGLHVALLFMALAVAGLAAAFLGDDFSLRYVALHSSGMLPPLYKLCALWSGAEGITLLSAFLLALSGSFAVSLIARRDADRPRAAWIVAALGLMLCLAAAISAFGANPFAQLVRSPSDGRGLDPILQNPAMAMQPPLLLFGAASAAVPLALMIAALICGRRGGRYFTRLRASSLVAWATLTVALLIGAHWAYVSPGLRGYWSLRSVESAITIEWTALTSLLAALTWKERVSSHANLLQRRAASIIAAGGLLLMALALAARPFAKSYAVQLGDGEQYRAKDAWGHAWTFTSQGASRMERPGADVTAVALLPTRDGLRQPFVASESRDYFGEQGVNVFPPFTAPGIHSALLQDLYVVLVDARQGQALLRISFKPLVEPLWIGGVLLVLGGLLLFWPARLGGAS